MPADDGEARRTEELAAMIREIRERVRARYPSGVAGEVGVALPDLMPLVHARDAAEAKVGAIGTVNPRRPGLLNDAAQMVKRAVARLLGWFVREQIEYNRATVECINVTIETLGEANRAIAQLAALQDGLRRHVTEALEGPVMEELREQKDIRSHWREWRLGWEEKVARNEIQFLRGLADLRAAYDHRVAQIEANFRDLVRSQHADFEGALNRSTLDIQKKLWDDFARIREEYERLIHSELRVLRQRVSAWREEAAPPGGGSPGPGQSVPALDYLRFADRFRGSEEYVRTKQQFYVEEFRGCQSVLDVGCGRGEFLEVLREADIPAQGIDLSAEFVAVCRAKQLAAQQADLFEYLASSPAAFDGIFCSQVIEHLSPASLPEFVRLAAGALSRGGLLAVETPNPECLAIFASHFYLDPTHTRPVPAPLMSFYLEEAGFGRIEVHPLSPAVESMPALAELPEGFRREFFGGLDYAILARRL